ncbi:hypothetical protein [Comamonas piscis]
MTSQTKTGPEIIEEVYRRLYQDDSIAGQLDHLPYIAVHALPPGQFEDGANWRLDVAVCSSPEMHAAVLKAMATLQKEMRLDAPPLGSSAFG